MKQRNEKGIAHLGVIIAAVVVIAAVALGGWYVWQKDRNGGDSKSQSSSTHSGSATAEEDKVTTGKTFNCKDIFSVVYPGSLQAAMTSAQQCLISNVSIEEMQAVGPLPSEQLGLFFNTQSTNFTTNKEYLNDYIERSKEDSTLELKSERQLELDNGGTATLATIYGGHPTAHDFYFFVYIKNGVAITTSYPLNSSHKDTALAILKTIH